MKSACTVLLVALCASCAPNLQQVPEESLLGGEGRTPEERELNRAALDELRERALSRAGDEADHEDSGDPDRLEVVTLGPPPAVTESGELRRTAIDAFHARGPHAVLGAVMLEPARDASDSVLGFRIAALNAGSAFVGGAGLRVGDVVTAVNGRSIVLPDEFMAVWDSLPEASELSVDYLRDGEAAHLSWPIREDL